jgi:hypothetical protein
VTVGFFRETVTAATIGIECADFLQHPEPSEQVNDLIRRTGVSDCRMRYEIFALEVFSTNTALVRFIDNETVRNRALSAFNDRLATQDGIWAHQSDAVADRCANYAVALNSPRTIFGPGFRIGQCFAASCERAGETRLIRFAASLYHHKVARLSTLLEDVRVSP